MRNQLRMEIWKAINGATISKGMFDVMTTSFGYEKTVAVVQLLEDSEYSYLFLDKNFAGHLPEDCVLSVDEVSEAAMLLAVLKVKIYAKSKVICPELKAYATALLDNINLLDARDSLTYKTALDDVNKQHQEILKISDYAKMLDKAEAKLEKTEEVLLVKANEISRNDFRAAMEIFCLFIHYVKDVKFLKEVFKNYKKKLQ